MARRVPRFGVQMLLAVLVLAGGVALAQSVLAQLGETEESARTRILAEFDNGGPSEGGSLGVAALGAYAKLSPAARGQVTAGFYAWTKAYVNSAAFKKAYADKRTETMPQPRPHPGTVDEELKATLDAKKTEFERTAKDAIAAGMKAYVDNMRQQMESPAVVNAARTEIEETRARDKAGYDANMEAWRRDYPADPMVAIARYLREFLATTTDVDFAAKATKVLTAGAFDHYEFANPAYNQKPWQWRWAYPFGPEALSAARTAAAAWVKEIGAK